MNLFMLGLDSILFYSLAKLFQYSIAKMHWFYSAVFNMMGSINLPRISTYCFSSKEK